MKIAVLGTGMVGQTLGAGLVAAGHEVIMGSRTAENEKLKEFQDKTGGQVGTFAFAAQNSDVLINCTNGLNSIEALSMIDYEHIDNKVLIDVANELKFEDGKMVSLANAQNSLAVKIQSKFPKVKVVKTFNTLNVHLMVNPRAIEEDHKVFMSGNDDGAKQIVSEIIQSLGWADENIVDLGAVDTAIGAEMYMAFWLTLFASGKFGDNAMFNINIVR